jgi:hypothetical protein
MGRVLKSMKFYLMNRESWTEILQSIIFRTLWMGAHDLILRPRDPQYLRTFWVWQPKARTPPLCYRQVCLMDTISIGMLMLVISDFIWICRAINMNNFCTRATLEPHCSSLTHTRWHSCGSRNEARSEDCIQCKEDVRGNTVSARCVGRAVLHADVSALCDRYATPPDLSGSLWTLQWPPGD